MDDEVKEYKRNKDRLASVYGVMLWEWALLKKDAVYADTDSIKVTPSDPERQGPLIS